MILNGYAVLDGFLTMVRLVLAVLVFGLALATWWRWRRQTTPEARTALEDRSYLLYLLAAALLVAAVASWPLLYLLLQSYVPQWPDVMCIYGVTQVGSRSRGISRFLPGLLEALQIMKPALVFLSGAWLSLHLVNRQTRTGAVTGSVLAVLVVLGLLAFADATAEGAYLVIPKKDETLSAGCCTGEFGPEVRPSPGGLVGDRWRPWLEPAYYAVNIALIVLLGVSTRSRPGSGFLRWPTLLLPGAILALVVSGLFLVDGAAPTLLHQPNHHCAYDLLPQAPHSVAAIVLFFLGSFGVGWAVVLRWFANSPETKPWLPGAIRGSLALALGGYLGSLALMSVALFLA
jgi:hypothetical protein